MSLEWLEIEKIPKESLLFPTILSVMITAAIVVVIIVIIAAVSSWGRDLLLRYDGLTGGSC